jgi:hypothetical protein
MIILAKLLLAHFIGDFLLQPESWTKDKELYKIKSIKLFFHIFIHGFLVLLFLLDLKNWLLIILLMISHGLVELMKLYNQKEYNSSHWLLIEQILHIISITSFWFLFFNPEINIKALLNKPEVWIYSVSLLFITNVSSVVMKLLMLSWSKTLDENNDESLNNAGKYIGMLERVFVFVFVIIGKWEGVGFLLAAKSVFRFGDLKESKDRKLTEYILIGTLLSFGIAIAVAMLVIKLVEN